MCGYRVLEKTNKIPHFIAIYHSSVHFYFAVSVSQGTYYWSNMKNTPSVHVRSIVSAKTVKTVKFAPR